jgi:hypothetical protein
MKKDCYPLPCAADLLESLRKAKVYTKIDLQHAYPLVVSEKVTNGKLHSEPDTAPLNGVSCLSDLPMLRLHFSDL